MFGLKSRKSSKFVFLEALPLLPHGKVDRRALPNPDQARRPQLDGALIAPRDEIERRLTMLCESLLGVSPIGVCDDLFDIGIGSLRILRLLAQIEAGFAVHLAPATLLQSPTIAQLATILRKETAAKPSSTRPRIQTMGTKPPFLLDPPPLLSLTRPGATMNFVFRHRSKRLLDLGRANQ